MKRQRKNLILYTFIILFIPLLFAGYNDDQPSLRPKRQSLKKPENLRNPFMDGLLATYRSTMDELLEDTGIPGASIVIVKDTSVIFSEGFGTKMLNRKDPVDENTVFRIGSVSKAMAATLTAILVKDSILSWDDPIIQYVPEFQLKSAEQTPCLTIRHILSHTSGFPYHTYTTLIEDGVDLPTMLFKLREIDCSTLGETYSYQNVAFSLIGEVIEAATGKSYEQVLKERIFDPLEMNNASTSYSGIFYNKNIAQPHLIKRKKWTPIRISNKYYNVVPAGGVNASAQDMAQWLKLLLGSHPDILPESSVQQIFTPVIDAHAKNRNYRELGHIEGSYYGLGWRILHYKKDTLVYHGGYVNGYRSEVAVYPKDNIAICILSNAPGKFTDKGIPIFLKLYMAERRAIAEWEKRQHHMLQVRHQAFDLP